jgi:hypothetical protein
MIERIAIEHTMHRLLLATVLLLTLPHPLAVSADGVTSGPAGGRRCTVADRGSQVWFGFFKGYQSVFAPMKDGSGADDLTVWRCFEVEAECAKWSSGMLEKHPRGPTQTFCRQGR